ncbi:MAG: copper chaperone PCu(A)C [Acidimicrobiia bacterium]
MRQIVSQQNRAGALRLTTALLLVAVSACGGGGRGDSPQVSDARIGQPTGPNAALYFTADGYGEDDQLVGAATDVAPKVEIHETVMGDNGTMGMQPVESLDLPASGQLVLEPGGYHVMLVGVDRLDVGAKVKVTLDWKNAGEQTIEAEVVEPSETMDDMGDMGDEG